MSRRKYSIKKIFGPSVVGEGSLVGEVSSFIYFGGCNMWDGRRQTKSSSRCPFCDTDFADGELVTANEIVRRVQDLMPKGWVTLTGGEPLLQLDYDLADSLVHAGFRLALETNGTRHITHDLRHLVEHISMSPKQPIEQTKLREADDVKVLFPHPDMRITPESFENYPAKNKFVQPIHRTDSLDVVNIARATAKLFELNSRRDNLDGGGWRLSCQLNKAIGVL